MANAYSAVLFDLDGTLLASIGGIVRSFEHALGVQVPAHTLTRRDLVMTIGEPLPAQMLQFASEDAALSTRLVETYRAHNRSISETFSLYPDVAPVIDDLAARGFALGLVTSKHAVSASATLSVASQSCVVVRDDNKRAISLRSFEPHDADVIVESSPTTFRFLAPDGLEKS